jgi:hypothetical protein
MTSGEFAWAGSTFAIFCIERTLWTLKVGKRRKSLTNPWSGGKGRNLIIPFIRKRLILPCFYSVLFSLTMLNWNKGGFVYDIVKGRKIKQMYVKNCDSFQQWKKSEFMTRQGIPSFHHVFRSLLAGIIIYMTFPYQLLISETLAIVFRLLLFIVGGDFCLAHFMLLSPVSCLLSPVSHNRAVDKNQH